MDDIGVDAFGRTIVGNDTTEDNSDSRRHREYDRNSRDRDRDRELAEPRVNYPRDSYYNSRAGYSNGGENNNSEYNRIRRGDGGGFVGQKRGRDEFSSQHHRSGRGGGDWGVQGRGNRGRGERGFRDDRGYSGIPQRGGGRGFNDQKPPGRADSESCYLDNGVKKVSINPLMSFKSFMLTQPDDLAPEAFQTMYQQYNLQYLDDFSDAFFKTNMMEEWFQERYNPEKIIEMAKDNSEWAASESEAIKKSLLENTVATVSAMCLDPPIPYPAELIATGIVKPPLPAKPRADSVDEKQEDAAAEEEEEGKKPADSGVKDTPTEVDSSPIICGKKFDGHEDRTIYISGVYSYCSKKVLREAINKALTTTNTEDGFLPAATRVLVTQPSWSSRPPVKFEKSAWVVMPTAASAKQAVAALRDLTVGIPGPLDPETGEAKIIFSFTISAMLHNPQMRNQGHGASDIRSHAQRVTVDTTRALELAELLDDEREVPETSRLHSIFKESTVESALKKPTDKLDVAVAYLRRVHFVMFYTGKRFRDEAHMLSLAPSIIHRSAHYIPDPAVSFSPAPPAGPPPKPLGQPPAKSQAVVDATLPDDNKNEESTAAEDVPSDVLTTTEISSTEEAVDQSVGEKRKREEDEEESFSKAVKVNDDGYNVDNKSEKEEDGEDNEQQVASPDKGKSGGGNRQFTQRAVGNGYRRKVPLSDRRVETMLNDFYNAKQLRMMKKANPQLAGTDDEEDAILIQEKQAKTFDEQLQLKCKLEKEGKSRCCYLFCNKLFKGIDFLRKHLKSKHEYFAEDILVKDAEVFMKKRFVSEDIRARPLPPLEVEVQGGVELKSVVEILDKYLVVAPPLPPLVPPGADFMLGANPSFMNPMAPMGMNPEPMFLGDNGRFSNDNRDFNRGNRRGRDDRDRRNSNNSAGGNTNSGGGWNSRESFPKYVGPKSEDNNQRKLSSYLDVDAPKETTMDIDYGVAILPPVKKKKAKKSM